MKLALKTPSQWLKILCREWSKDNIHILPTLDANFLQYKSYLRGLLSSQLLCRVSIYSDGFSSEKDPSKLNFWKMLGVQDDFDCDYISSQVEKFCSLYGLRNHAEEENPFVSSTSSSNEKASPATAHTATKTVDNSNVPPTIAAVGNNAPVIPYIIDNPYASTPVIPVAGMHPSITYPNMSTTYTDPTTAALAMTSSAAAKQVHKKGKIDISLQFLVKSNLMQHLSSCYIVRQGITNNIEKTNE